MRENIAMLESLTHTFGSMTGETLPSGVGLALRSMLDDLDYFRPCCGPPQAWNMLSRVSTNPCDGVNPPGSYSARSRLGMTRTPPMKPRTTVTENPTPSRPRRAAYRGSRPFDRRLKDTST